MIKNELIKELLEGFQDSDTMPDSSEYYLSTTFGTLRKLKAQNEHFKLTESVSHAMQVPECGIKFDETCAMVANNPHGTSRLPVPIPGEETADYGLVYFISGFKYYFRVRLPGSDNQVPNYLTEHAEFVVNLSTSHIIKSRCLTPRCYADYVEMCQLTDPYNSWDELGTRLIEQDVPIKYGISQEVEYGLTFLMNGNKWHVRVKSTVGIPSVIKDCAISTMDLTNFLIAQEHFDIYESCESWSELTIHLVIYGFDLNVV